MHRSSMSKSATRLSRTEAYHFSNGDDGSGKVFGIPSDCSICLIVRFSVTALPLESRFLSVELHQVHVVAQLALQHCLRLQAPGLDCADPEEHQSILENDYSTHRPVWVQDCPSCLSGRLKYRQASGGPG